MADTQKVRIGEVEYAFKRANLATMKRHLEFMKASARMARDSAAGIAPDGAAIFDQLLEMAQIVHECILRAQPEVTLEQILEGLDQDNIAAAYGLVMQGSGYVPAGEPKAAAVAG